MDSSADRQITGKRQNDRILDFIKFLRSLESHISMTYQRTLQLIDGIDPKNESGAVDRLLNEDTWNFIKRKSPNFQGYYLSAMTDTDKAKKLTSAEFFEFLGSIEESMAIEYLDVFRKTIDTDKIANEHVFTTIKDMGKFSEFSYGNQETLMEFLEELIRT